MSLLRRKLLSLSFAEPSSISCLYFLRLGRRVLGSCFKSLALTASSASVRYALLRFNTSRRAKFPSTSAGGRSLNNLSNSVSYFFCKKETLLFAAFVCASIAKRDSEAASGKYPLGVAAAIASALNRCKVVNSSGAIILWYNKLSTFAAVLSSFSFIALAPICPIGDLIAPPTVLPAPIKAP